VARAQAQTDTITWQEHHAVIDIAIPSLTLSTATGCAQAVTATTTVRVGSGNSVAVEGGSRKVIQSATYALPGGVL
jgi:Flp pilus assembly secretin CpaC